MMQPTRILAGAMSGTSADGVDVAIARIAGRGVEMSVKLLAHRAHPYPRELSARIHRVRGGGGLELVELAELGRAISLVHVEAVNAAMGEAGVDRGEIAGIAAHGQTLFHDPPNTIQWFDPSLVAAGTGCAVISDFRRADLAAGGQGAPLVPFADYILFRDMTKSRVLLNIGGVANVTILPAGCAIDEVIAFDTGPGNCISDWLCRTLNSSGPGHDVGGGGAERGTAIEEIVRWMLAQPYFASPPPKSTDGPAMIAMFDAAVRQIRPGASLDDLLATAAEVTARSIQSAIRPDDEVIASGGGVRNGRIMRLLKGGRSLRVTDDLGVPFEAKEAVAFALLGAATLDGEPSNVPSVTGASRRAVLGSITPKP